MNPSLEARSASFQQLKPVCTKLSEVALRQEKSDTKELNGALQGVLERLKALPVLDAKLADYAFFPLSYVIKDAGSIPAKSLSLAVQCLELLIKRGWQGKADEALVRELAIFLTTQLSKTEQDDLRISFLSCLDTLIQSMKSVLTEVFSGEQEETSAIAGQLIYTLLGIAKDSPSIEIQVSSVNALGNLISALDKKDLLRIFLPGIVSQLSNILRLQVRRSYRVLTKAIEILGMIIGKTLADRLIGKDPSNDDKSWIKATSSQLLLALSSFVSLRYHDRPEVLDALTTLCATILDDCRTTLENCRALMLESLCIIGSQDQLNAKTTLDVLVASEVISSKLQELVYKWCQTLSRRLQSPDDQQAERCVALICEGYRALDDSGINLGSLNQEIFEAVRNSAQLLLHEDKKSKQVDDLPDLSIRDLVVSKPSVEMKALGSLNAPYLRLLQMLVCKVNPLSVFDNGEMLVDDNSLASLWIMTRGLSDRVRADGAFQQFVSDLSISAEVLDMALDKALGVLTANTENVDWRSQALALELITLVAQQEKEDFRTSLVDTLFPLVELVGTPDQYLRQYAITSLNSVSIYCGYTGPGDMIVQNVDYLVNAVALKFNTFDVSPQAVQVLVIMLELSGPALIPYLDDLVDSIFGALAAYHGYPRLVEVMFSALAAIVKHGSSASSSISSIPRIEHTKQRSKLTQISDIPAIINNIRHPQSQDDLMDETTEEANEESDTALQTTMPSTELDKAEKPPKIYLMVQSVLRLSQHYLTHREPYLRQRLLELISVGCTSLSRNEEQFLPLVNDIWPVVILRLYDQEAIVVLAAMQALSSIFVGAGDFFSTRVQDEWPQIKAQSLSIQDKAVAGRKGSGRRGLFTYAERLYDGMIAMLVQLILHVRVKSHMEDDLFEMLGPLARERMDVRDALEVLNPDALWLVLEAPKFMKSPPTMDGFKFADLKAM